MKKKILLWVITLIVLTALFSAADPAKAVEVISKAKLLPLMAAALLSFLFPVLSALRWKWIMKRLDEHISLWDSLKLILAAWPLATITPAKSGDLIKVLFLKDRLPYSQTAGLLIAERLIDVAVLSLSAAIGGLILGIPQVSLAGACIFLGVIGFFIVFSMGFLKVLPQKYQTLGENVVLASQRIFSEPFSLLPIVLITFMNWFASYLQTWLCYVSLQAAVSLGYVCAALPIAIFTGLLPITTAGMGTRDAAMIYLFEAHAPYETNLALGILYSIFGYWMLTLIGLPFMRLAFNGKLLGVNQKDLKGMVSVIGKDSKENIQ